MSAIQLPGRGEGTGSLRRALVRVEFRAARAQTHALGRDAVPRTRHAASRELRAPLPTRRSAAAGAPCAAAGGAAGSAPAPTRLERIADVATMLFPVWALISGTVAFVNPSSLSWMTNLQFERGVGLLMLAMGLSLTTDDFRKCAARPGPIFLGFVCQYSILPVLAFTIAKLMNLSPAFATGLILLGCCPGGQASNVATHVAHGDVALSVLMTSCSTLAACVMTPLLAAVLAGQFIPIDAWALAESTVRLVLVPTLAGVALNELFTRQVDAVRPLLPLVALALTVVLCAVPVAQVADVLRSSGGAAVVPVLILHACGYLLGYLLPRFLGFTEKVARTVSIETGMQSAAMGYTLSVKHFADVMVCVPSSVSIVIMVWLGAALAVVWRMMPIRDGPASSPATS